MPQVIFSHKKGVEREYLNQLLEEKEWFESEKFDAFLPKNKDQIEKEIIKKDGSLSKRVIWLGKEWEKIEKDYFKAVKKFRHKKLHSIYECHVSRFGPEGKYTRPNLLFIRLRTNRDKQRVMETIGHELLHLLFADIFASEKLTYAEREGMVDALILQSNLSKLFPQYEKQSIGKVRRKLFKSILA
jgi:hypothetical protein